MGFLSAAVVPRSSLPMKMRFQIKKRRKEAESALAIPCERLFLKRRQPHSPRILMYCRVNISNSFCQFSREIMSHINI